MRSILVSVLTPWQAGIYRFTIDYRPLLYLSCSIFVNTINIYTHTLIRLHLSSHYIFFKCVHKCRNQTNDDKHDHKDRKTFNFHNKCK